MRAELFHVEERMDGETADTIKVTVVLRNFVTVPKKWAVMAAIDHLIIIIIIITIIIIIITASTSAPKPTPPCIQNLPKSLNPKANRLDHEDDKHMAPYLHYHFTT